MLIAVSLSRWTFDKCCLLRHVHSFLVQVAHRPQQQLFQDHQASAMLLILRFLASLEENYPHPRPDPTMQGRLPMDEFVDLTFDYVFDLSDGRLQVLASPSSLQSFSLGSLSEGKQFELGIA